MFNQEDPLLNRTIQERQPYSLEDFDGYRAAPVAIVGEDADPELKQAQHRLTEKLADATHGELDGRVKPSVVNFVIHSMRTRMRSREGQNGASYALRLHETPNYAAAAEYSIEDVDTACESLLTGRGSVAQNDLARRAFGMASIEYANLTVVGNFRQELDAPMWNDVNEFMGKNVRPRGFDDFYRVEFVSFDRHDQLEQHVGALRVGLKSQLGTREDGTEVKMRTTAIIDTSPLAGFSREITSKLVTAKLNGDLMHEQPEFRNVVRWIVNSAFDPEYTLARNETIYGFNPQVAASIKHAIN